ncbi:2-octaprenyl-6-methoxyphenyl hydroxylase [Luteimonas sp. BDR2-5]|uniref:2-octaprenyl-6-methoxyphenyl hydroxylase n=1 Tax=Proluteimonas luteida TaxID=2878685 RepID=UPI001E3104EF|nr:2-octaprenyl-6-methoxyphenyl hydroxylase [Luteimonas sp. BDR2-5]MCD9028917.1 2-octaprenyl-6-methoxyphenyl hydroxylase [Luteimonas sp. BDR2-5]
MTNAQHSGGHEVVIVGGGLVGASLAVALDRAGIDTALVEATPPGAMPAVFDQRNLSFAEATVNALTALGILQKLQVPAGPIRQIHISRAGDFGRVGLDAAGYGRDSFGQVVVARDFGDALEARLGELTRLTRYRPARFIGFGDAAGRRGIRIAGPDGERLLQARLVVGADGADSAVRAALGIGAQVHDYRQRLFIARVRPERAPDGRAFERLTDHGPTALLPRGDRHYGIVHGVDADAAAAVEALDDAPFLARLQSVFGWRAGRFLGVGPRSSHPARRVVADDTVGTRTVLVGNAAQSLHPIGAQGFNLGLRDALTLAELVADASDPGAPALLDAYAARRREDRARTLAFSDGLARLSANPSPLLRPLRSLGLLAIDRDAGLQALLAGGAMGYRGDVPALCRGVAA